MTNQEKSLSRSLKTEEHSSERERKSTAMQNSITESNTKENSKYTTEIMVGKFTILKTTIMAESKHQSSRHWLKALKLNEDFK